MAEKGLSFRIGAKDDASAVLKKVSGAAKSEMGQVEDALDDTRSAGKRMADGLSAVADELESELEGTERAAERLGEALGPELKQRVGQGGIDKMVDDLRAAGLTFDDIEQEADELAAAIKRLEDAGTKAGGGTRRVFDDVDTSVRKVGDTTDRTGSVMANFAGNAVQDIPGISGSFGALNQAAGEFVEHAAEGGINLKNLAKAAGPLALVTVAIGGIASVMSDTNAAAAFNADKIERWVEKVLEGSTAVEALIDDIKEAGKLEVGVPQQADDLTEALDKLSLSYQDFIDLTKLSEDAIIDWAVAQREGGSSADSASEIMEAAIQTKRDLAETDEIAAQKQRVYGKALDESTEDLKEQEKAAKDTADAHRDLIDATLAGFNSQLGFEDAVASTNDALADLREAEIAAATAGGDLAEEARNLAAAENDAAEAALSQAAAAVQVATDNAKAAGGTLSARDAAALQIVELQKVAGTLASDAPLRVRLEGYIAQLARIERNIHTTVTIDTPAPAAGGRTAVRRHGGGLVPGPEGREVPAVLTGGEGVFTPSQMDALGLMIRGGNNRGGGGGVQIIRLEVDGRVLAEIVRDRNEDLRRRSGL